MTKKGIFDVDGLGDFNNPELLRPVQSELHIYDQNETFPTQEQPKKRSVSNPTQKRTKSRSKKESPPKQNPLPNTHTKQRKPHVKILWILFLLLTIGCSIYTFMLYQGNGSSFSQLLLKLNILSQIGIMFTLWLFLFIILLFITHKKVGAFFLVLLLAASNFSAFKANEIVSGLQNLFSSNDTAQTTAVKTSTKNILTEPFTVLVLGVDADDSESPKSSSLPNGGYLSDTMILVTINPKTHKADMVTTPRDTFLYDSCSQSVRKLNAFIGGGINCTINTFESLYGIKIDYFVQANFAAVVQIVDGLGGVEVNVPDLVGNRQTSPSYLYWVSHGGSLGEDSVSQKKLNELANQAEKKPQWCDVDSHRNPYTVCFDKFGVQTVDGEHALAFARSRHYDSDYARGMRQTELIRAILQKMASPAGLFQIQSILEKLKKTYAIETNMTFSQMTDIMTYAESLAGRDTENFQVRKYQPLGTTETPYEGSGILLYRKSILEIRNALSITLETTTPAPITESEYYDTIEYPSFKTNQ